MKTLSRPVRLVIICLALSALLAAGLFLFFRFGPYGYARKVSNDEKSARSALLEAAQGWLGKQEADGSHREIIDLYNSHSPLAQGYTVSYEDEWCDTFVSASAIKAGLTHIIPTECGCERHIGLFADLGCWNEDDGYVPLPGDLIFYCWKDIGLGDCTGWSNHVGIVVGTLGPFIKVIEGNRDGQVTYRYIAVNAPGIRGFATPDYSRH